MSTEPAAPPEARGSGLTAMSLLEHLDELRRRLVLAAVGVAAGFALCYWQADRLMEWCAAPYVRIAERPLSVMAVSEAFFVKIRVAFMATLFLTAPWTAWQAWSFIRPALYPKERRLAVPFMLAVAGFFVAGGAFAYYVGFPFMLAFLLEQAAQGFTVDVRAESYVATFTSVVLGLGLVFEAPVLAAILARLGLLDHRWLARKWRAATVLVTMAAAVITPSGDIPTMLVFALPMMALYAVSIVVAWAFRRRQP